jgi:hypothetical protein
MNQSLVVSEPTGLLRGETDENRSLLTRARVALRAIIQRVSLSRRNEDGAGTAGKVIYLRKIIPRVGVLNFSGALPKSEVIVVVYECPRGGRVLPRIQVTEIA